jgi:adenosylhomocysteinase
LQPSEGSARIEWADEQMPVLRRIRARFERDRPLDGLLVAACLHVTAETANLCRTLTAGGASVSLCASNPLTTQDDVGAALVEHHGVQVLGARGEDFASWSSHVDTLVAQRPQITLDDGADLILALHAGDPGGLIGGTEETTTGLVKLRALEADGGLKRPVMAVNEAHTERAFNDRYGTGQSAIDGIIRATNLLLAGRTMVVLGYGWAGKGVAQRARGLGASVIVCEVDELRALEARMEGFDVMPALEAAERGDVFITVTGVRDVLVRDHFERMKDGAVLANAGHFDVEISIPELRAAAVGEPREVLPLVHRYELPDGRRLSLLAHGHVVNLAAAQGHPAGVMDLSFASQALAAEELALRGADLPPAVVAVPARIDREIARLKLESLGVAIDELTTAQRDYLHSWRPGS